MPDITKCEGKGCPIKESCWRYTSEDDQRQTYFALKEGESLYRGGSCHYYWKDDSK